MTDPLPPLVDEGFVEIIDGENEQQRIQEQKRMVAEAKDSEDE